MSELKHPVLRTIGALTRTVHAIAENHFAKLGLTRGQFLYVARICENPGINQMELSAMLKVDKTRAAKSLKKLMEAEIVTRVKNENDSRSYLLYPTSKGQSIYESIIEEENRQIDVCLENFTDAEKEQVTLLLSKMVCNLEEDWNLLKKADKTV